MTFSILARDPNSCALGGAAATGSLCVGGWVLRGKAGIGLSASQGKSPSTLWGDAVLDHLADGVPVGDAAEAVIRPDPGRDQRQLTVIDASGAAAAFSGAQNTPEIADRTFAGGVAAGNMLAGGGVIDAMIDHYLGSTLPFAERLLAALTAGQAAGSDIRGIQSAALLVVAPDRAPLTLRIDYAADPLTALGGLLSRATRGDYADWARQVPTLTDPYRTLT